MSRALTLVVALLAAATAAAQGSEISIAVLPFGAIQTTGAPSRSTALLAQQSVSALDSSRLYTVIDRSTDTAIEDELKKAESFRNFDSRVSLTTTERLNAAVLLIGVVEKESIEMKPSTGRGGKPTYVAQLGVRVKLVRTSTGELIKSQYFDVENQTASAQALEKRNIPKVPKFLQKEIAKRLDEKVADKVQKDLKVEMRDGTPDEAVRGAAEALKPKLADFLQETYGAVVAATRRK